MAKIMRLNTGLPANIASHAVKTVHVITVSKIMLLGDRFSAANCALFHVVHSISGRHPSAALMCTGDGRDGGRFFVVANAALSAFGSRFGGGRFLCDLPLAVSVSGFLYICVAIVASLPMTDLIKFPVGKVGVVTGIKLAIRFAADFAPFRFGAGGSAAGVSSFLYNRTAILAGLPMAGLIRCPVGKGGMVTGIKLTVWFAADFALFRFGAGGGAAGVGGFLYDCAAICALFHMMFSVIGRFPRSAALMRAWAGGGDGFGLRFMVADGAYLMPGTRFSGGRLFIDDPVAIGVGGIINAGCVTVCTVFPVVGLIRRPAGKGGMVIGVKLAIRLVANLALFLCVAGGGTAGVGCKVQLFGAVGVCTAMPMTGGVRCPCITTNVRMGSRGADGNLRCIRLPGGFVAVYDGRMDGTAVGIIVGDGDSGSAGNGEISKGTVALRGLNGGVVGGIVGGNKGGVGNGNVIRPKRRAITGGGREGDAGDSKIAKDRNCRTARCCAQG